MIIKSFTPYQWQRVPAKCYQEMRDKLILRNVDEKYRESFLKYYNQKNILNENLIIEARKEPMFSYYIHPVTNTKPYKAISLAQVYDVIKDPKKFGSSTDTFRAITDKTKGKQYKAVNFDYVTFSGVFSSRSDDNLISHSGLLSLDFDHADSVGALRSQLLADVMIDVDLLFISPSGNGLKLVTSIDLSKGTHAQYFYSFRNYFMQKYGVKIDECCNDVSRACFICHDPEVFIHPKHLSI